MITIEKQKRIIEEVNDFLYIIKYSSNIIKIETKTEIELKKVFQIHSEMFWDLENKNNWLDKCYKEAQRDLSEIEKMRMSKNPQKVITFISTLTKEWNDEINKDKKLNKVLKNNYVDSYNFAGQSVLNEFKINASFNLRGIKFLNSLDKRVNLTSPEINRVSWELVQNRIADGFWKEGNNTDRVARDIKDLFDETYKNRAKNIARTETGQVVSEAQFISYKQMQIKKLKWIAEVGACELCSPLRGNIVNVGENFNNGMGWIGLHPLVHPSCRCDVAPVVGKEFIPSKYWTGEDIR